MFIEAVNKYRRNSMRQWWNCSKYWLSTCSSKTNNNRTTALNKKKIFKNNFLDFWNRFKFLTMDNFFFFWKKIKVIEKTVRRSLKLSIQQTCKIHRDFFKARGRIRKAIRDGSFFVHTWKHSYVHQEGSFHCSACAWLRVASVQGKTRQQADGTAGPLKIDTELQPSPSRAIPMQMNCTDTDVTWTLAGIDFSKGFQKVLRPSQRRCSLILTKRDPFFTFHRFLSKWTYDGRFIWNDRFKDFSTRTCLQYQIINFLSLDQDLLISNCVRFFARWNRRWIFLIFYSWHVLPKLNSLTRSLSFTVSMAFGKLMDRIELV